MRRLKSIVSILLIIAFTALSVFCFTSCNYFGIFKNNMQKAIEERGGVSAKLKPENDYDATDAQLEAAKTIIETRMVSSGITDYSIIADNKTDCIEVTFPWKEDEKEFNTDKTIEELISAGKLTFRPGNEYEDVSYGSDGNPVYSTPAGETTEVLMDGSYVKSAEAGVNSASSDDECMVNLEFNKEGTEKFADITEKYSGKVISIWMDEVMISAPTVQAVISDGKAQITGDFTAEEAYNLASKINLGSLPFEMKTVEVNTISAMTD